MKTPGHPVLVQDRARYVGEPVAVVIAETYAEARDAADALAVDYDPLPAVIASGDAQGADAPQVHADVPNNTAFDWCLGDKAETDAAFAKAHHVTSIDLVNNRLVPNAMEPRAALGDYDKGTDVLTIYTTSQNPHVARLVLSAFVGLAPEHKLRIVAPDVGGGFGSKIYIYSEETICAFASRQLGRPVKWTAERSESFITDAHGRDHVTTAELAMDENGNDSGPAGQDHRQYRRLRQPVRHRDADLSLRAAAVRPVQDPGDLCRGGRGLHQHRAGGRLSRCRAAGSDHRGRTDRREGRAGNGDRPVRVPDAQLRAARRVPVPDAGVDEPTTAAISTPTWKRRWRTATTPASRPARPKRRAVACCGASASRPISKPAASPRRRRWARWAAASGCGKAARSASTPPAM